MIRKQFVMGLLAAGALAACGGRQHTPEPSTHNGQPMGGNVQTARGTVGEESRSGATGGTGMQDHSPGTVGTDQSSPAPGPNGDGMGGTTGTGNDTNTNTNSGTGTGDMGTGTDTQAPYPSPTPSPTPGPTNPSPSPGGGAR